MGAVVLSTFAIALCLVQISCSKSDAQSRPTDISQIGKIIFLKNWGTTAQIWTANYDGSNPTQVPITLPLNVNIDMNVTSFALSISPDGQKIFFTANNYSSATPTNEIYSCDINGANLVSIASGAVSRVHAY